MCVGFVCRSSLLAADGARGAAFGGAGSNGGHHTHGGGAELVFVCAYEGGKLLHEEALSMQDLELIFGPGKVRRWKGGKCGACAQGQALGR